MDIAEFPSGRKVFYFFPLGTYHQHVVKEIIYNEFEIYTLSDLKRGLPLIFQYNGAIILFHVDELPHYEQGKAVIRDFCRQTSHRSIELFLLTTSPERIEDIDLYMKDLDNCRSFLLKGDPKTTGEEIIGLLSDLKARGQRRYVRFGSNKDEVARIELSRKDKPYTGSVHDISSVGLSFSMPEGPTFSVRTKLRDFSLKIDNLETRMENLHGTITIRRKLPKGNFLYVVLFDKDLPEEIRNQLHTIIHSSLQRQFTRRLDDVAIP